MEATANGSWTVKDLIGKNIRDVRPLDNWQKEAVESNAEKTKMSSQEKYYFESH